MGTAITVALRKESVDRNSFARFARSVCVRVALRKESVDRNKTFPRFLVSCIVALRKESVDRNNAVQVVIVIVDASLSARRAWIEICGGASGRRLALSSLSARRAWIEIVISAMTGQISVVALRKESVDRNPLFRLNSQH